MSREDRIAKNEVLFREVNERIDEVHNPPDAPFEIVCECGNADCLQMLEVRPREYRAVRSEATHFFVLPGHEAPDVETVLDSTSRFNIVEKHEDEAEPAIASHRSE